MADPIPGGFNPEDNNVVETNEDKNRKDSIEFTTTVSQPDQTKPESLASSESAPGTDLDRETLDQIITTNQEVYTSLQIKENPDNTGNLINLEHELKQGNILLPSQEEHEVRTEAGYIPIIIPGHLTREAITSIFEDLLDRQTYSKRDKQQNQLELDIVFLIGSQAREDLLKTNSQINKTRPQQLYLTYFKPDQDIYTAHRATVSNLAEECLNILEQERQSNPELNLQGLTLEEYLTLQAYIKQTTNQYVDRLTSCWLLEDTVPDPDPKATKPARCLRLGWSSDDFHAYLSVSSGFFDSRHSAGSRFQAMPEYKKTN